jgi:ubiquinol-cytochrome c reductase cytochrome b subunit/cytochrome b6
MGFSKWLSKSFPVDQEAMIQLTAEPIPNHLKRWWWALGGTPMYMFVVQVITGLMLIFYYVPDTEHAYKSIAYITYEADYGWLIRSIHRWSSNIMIASLILHMMRVFFTKSYKAPRDLNWMFGVVLFLLTLMLGFTGYSLVYEQMSYWAMKVGTGIAGATPFIGGWIADFMRGGSDIGQNTLTRFFLFHVVLLPILIALAVVVHLYLIRTHGVTEHKFKGDENLEKKTFPLFPDHVMTELVMVSIIMVMLVVLSILFPAQLGDPANPNVTPLHIKPEWYFYPVFRWLKVTNLMIGVLGPMTFLGILFFWPFIDKTFDKWFPEKEVGFWIGIIGMLTICVFTIWEIFGH